MFLVKQHSHSLTNSNKQSISKWIVIQFFIIRMLKKYDNMVELVGVGFVINRATPSSINRTTLSNSYYLLCKELLQRIFRLHTGLKFKCSCWSNILIHSPTWTKTKANELWYISISYGCYIINAAVFLLLHKIVKGFKHNLCG